MSKGDIENTIRCYLDLPHDQKPIGWVGQLAREIAQAAEEDRAELMAVANNTRELWIQSREEVAKLRAQVAMMSDGLRGIRDEVEPSVHLSSMDLKVWNMAVDTLCLSAAPKVWRVKGRTSLHYDIEVMAEGAPEEFRQLLISRSMFAPWDVMVCLPKAGQPTESEQGEEEREDG